MDEMTLRDYRPGDWEAMYALDLVCFEPVFQFSRRTMRSFAEEPGAVTLLAEADGELVGFCIAHLEEKTGYVVTLDVAPAWRRCGVARLLMEEVEARVHAAGGLGMALHVYTGNVGAMQFYEALGYGRVSIAKGFYGRGMDALVYRKKWQ
jgi:ribosomal-protein-alanine N-acetyltransferase